MRELSRSRTRQLYHRPRDHRRGRPPTPPAIRPGSSATAPSRSRIFRSHVGCGRGQRHHPPRRL